ncbi:glycosyltransferase [Bradyrhizobium sp. 2TAF24]|uniref:glycosyltransferase n=1 Tax=Bradyrhizobium sp. 2TAF24 TaxID=3233011 RepID=UPI003F90F7A3
MTAAIVFGVLAVSFVGLDLVRRGLALREIAAQARLTAVGDETAVTVLQPILGGDPALQGCLEANLRHAPAARFLWLVDDDDAAGQAAARQALAATSHPATTVVIAPRPPAGLNPKSVKLAAGLDHVATAFVAVLDDDTILPPGALGRVAAQAGPGVLVTGLPLYAARATLSSRLVTGFVNASSALTYLPAARLGLARTINGMFSLMRTADLRARGGFARIVHEVTDDYALARLFLDAGGRIVQSSQPVTVITTVQGARHWFALMRRWMVFARLYLRDNLSPGIALLVVLPEFLVLPLLLASLCVSASAVAVAIVLLVAKALATRALVRRLTGRATPLSDIPFEIAAELLLPLHALSASLLPHRIRWRDRAITLEGRRIVDG